MIIKTANQFIRDDNRKFAVSPASSLDFHHPFLTHHPAYYYAGQEVLITCDASGSVSAWYHGHLLMLEEVEKRSRQTAIVSSKSE